MKKKVIHYGTVNGPACGAGVPPMDPTSVDAWRDVTCKRCKVTDAFADAMELNRREERTPMPRAAQCCLNNDAGCFDAKCDCVCTPCRAVRGGGA